MRLSLNIVITLLALLSNFAYANNVECYAPSPNLTEFGETYYDLEKTSVLSDEEKNHINAFLKIMVGKWQGVARNIECKGPDSAPQINSRQAEITATMRSDSISGLSIDANNHYIEESIKKSEHLSLLGNTSVFNFVFVDEHHLVFSEKYRRMNKSIQKPKTNTSSSNLSTIINKIIGDTKAQSTTTKAPAQKKLSRITETIYNIAFENGLLIISRSYYTNGVFTGEDSWKLSRD